MSPRFNTHSSSPLTRELYIPGILFRTICAVHNAAKNESCFSVPNMILEGVFHIGVCNDRAKNAGMTGRISHASLIRYIPVKAKHGK